MKVAVLNKALGIGILFFLISFIILMTNRFIHTYREYSVFKTKELHINNALKEAQVAFSLKEHYLQRLIEDPLFFEWVVRQRLGYARPEEIIYHFGHSIERPKTRKP